MALRDTVLRNLLHYMQERRIANVTELARLSGVPQSVLSRFQSGVHGSINLDAIEKLAKTLEIDPGQLLQLGKPSVADQRTLSVIVAMENLPDWGKDAVAASAAAMLQTTNNPKPPNNEH